MTFILFQWYHGGPSDSNTRWRPPLRAVVCTACYRLFAAVYVICWLVADLLSNMDPCYWTFLTHWGQIVMVLYFGELSSALGTLQVKLRTLEKYD